MTAVLVGLVVVVVVMVIGWRLTWLATRVDRAQLRTERTWATLDTALLRRSQKVLELATQRQIDPATALLLSDAADCAREPDLAKAEREEAESALHAVLLLTGVSGIERENRRAMLARRLHNDAVSTASWLHERRTVRLFHLAGRASMPQPFEMSDDEQLLWSRGTQD